MKHVIRSGLVSALVVIACIGEGPSPRGIPFVSVRPPDHTGEEIYIINPDGTGERRLTFSGDGKNSNIPQWSPDGTQITFASNREDDEGRSSIYVMDADGTNVRRVTPVGSRDYFPHWSPDGSRIAFMSSRDGDEEIYVMSADGSGLEQLTDNDAFDVAYDWSPDGTQLMFSSDRGSHGMMVYLMHSDGSNVRAVGQGLGGGWADDENHLWYMDYPASMENGVPCYGMMDFEGSVMEQWCGPRASQGMKHGQCPSPDKTQIAFLDVPDGEVSFPVTEEQMNRAELYVAAVDGSDLRRLTFNEYYDGHCSW
jgi:Tol biopolymer transport system component